jgi:aminoglycoside phosphotransferase (APT) family kinase protein
MMADMNHAVFRIVGVDNLSQPVRDAEMSLDRLRACAVDCNAVLREIHKIRDVALRAARKCQKFETKRRAVKRWNKKRRRR